MTEPAAVGYLGVAALVAAVCVVICLVAAAVTAVVDRRTPAEDRKDEHA
ncbi:hypothetical protein [Streptomyces misionensis]